MSKLYQQYLEKKKVNSDKLYLFKNGNFYHFLGEDAKLMNKELHLQLTKFSSTSDKCGFPISEIEKYGKFIKLLGFEFEIVLSNLDQVLEDIKNTDLNQLSGEVAINKITKYQDLLGRE